MNNTKFRFGPSTLHEITRLLEIPEDEGGHVSTLTEILQQPATWRKTAQQMANSLSGLEDWMNGLQAVFLTGSGSSE